MMLKTRTIIAAVIGVVVSAAATASTVTLSGTGFSVSYDDSITSLFGTPTLNDGYLTFSPLAFGVSSSSTKPSFITGLLGLQVSTASGYVLNSVSLYEQGNFTLRGANSAFGVGTTLSVTPLDGAGAVNVDGQGEFSGSSFKRGTWIYSGAGAEVTGLSTKAADVMLDTLLFAQGGKGSFATANLTAAKLTFGVAQIPLVPEPDAYLMLLAGLGMVGAVARRRSAIR